MTREQYGKAYEDGLTRIVRLFMARGANCDEAQELAQQTWVRGWERLSQLRDDASFQAWINAIAVNVFRSARRRLPLLRLSEIPEPKWNLKLDAAIDVARVLGDSSSQDRRLFADVMAGQRTPELARERKVTNGAMLTRICRARRRLATRFRVNSVTTEKSGIKRHLNER